MGDGPRGCCAGPACDLSLAVLTSSLLLPPRRPGRGTAGPLRRWSPQGDAASAAVSPAVCQRTLSKAKPKLETWHLKGLGSGLLPLRVQHRGLRGWRFQVASGQWSCWTDAWCLSLFPLSSESTVKWGRRRCNQGPTGVTANCHGASGPRASFVKQAWGTQRSVSGVRTHTWRRLAREEGDTPVPASASPSCLSEKGPCASPLPGVSDARWTRPAPSATALCAMQDRGPHFHKYPRNHTKRPIL